MSRPLSGCLARSDAIIRWGPALDPYRWPPPQREPVASFIASACSPYSERRANLLSYWNIWELWRGIAPGGGWMCLNLGHTLCPGQNLCNCARWTGGRFCMTLAEIHPSCRLVPGWHGCCWDHPVPKQGYSIVQWRATRQGAVFSRPITHGQPRGVSPDGLAQDPWAS